MVELAFSEDELGQIKLRGITPETIISQIKIFERGIPYLKLDRPCTVGDGVLVISENELEELTTRFDEYAGLMGLLKFVPASGAASRMFQTLLRFNNDHKAIQKDEIVSKASQGDMESRQLMTFMDGIHQFAFLKDLKAIMTQEGHDAETLANTGRFKEIIDYLLTHKGLNYAQLPKGLLKFHRYPDHDRTAFEEHLVEASDYAKDNKGRCCLHFTVSLEHKIKFESLLETVRPLYEHAFGVSYHVDFSVQEKYTDTIAVDLDNRVFKQENGKILFRPGGHGALIENLTNLKGDIVFIKNIDNVVPDQFKKHTSLWKKALGGYLIRIRQRIFNYLERLTTGHADSKLLDDALEFSEKFLCSHLPADHKLTSDNDKTNYLIDRFNRPIRVCGMVRNEGEPGGGPFWVEADNGNLSLQIVEGAQVDSGSEEQLKILGSATHFNPVDIACSVRDFKGNPFDLRQYVDPGAVFISRKSKEGRELKALELPGLWNGAMAHWNTIFIEVPLITFNPVKTINDLLRKEHQ